MTCHLHSSGVAVFQGHKDTQVIVVGAFPSYKIQLLMIFLGADGKISLQV